MRILIIDDEPKIRRGMEKLIKTVEKDADVYTAEDGLLALELMKSIIPDIIFVDIKMPHMSGLEFISHAKEVSSHIQFVIASGYGEFEYAQQAIHYNVIGYILKPIMPAKIVEVLEKAKQNHLQYFKSLESLEELKMKYLDELLHVPYLSEEKLEAALNKIQLKNQYWILAGKSHKKLDDIKNELTTIIQKTCTLKCNILITTAENKIISILSCKEMHLCKCNNKIENALKSTMFFDKLISSDLLTAKEAIKHHIQLLLEQLDHDKDKGGSIHIVQKIKSYVHTNYQDKISLQDIAEQVYLHPAYISDLFKKTTGEKLTDYIMHIRIEKAKELLRTKDMKIYMLAEQVGFNNEKYFSKVFKELEGMTPNEYRREHQVY
ncbi:response regulator [Niameybacter massiliensis]|uniref:Stage 0 sporulation protein A homolog n=1 Tax=Holtiella tumoricola TaxID=3018743 RepID=A0AA42DMU3_9FIRM|nr:response regulator [Holtiella tumoricola]MDA3731835.1 response regulator [Holtiella tumoricola]